MIKHFLKTFSYLVPNKLGLKIIVTTRTHLLAMVSALFLAFLISHFYRASVGVLGPTFMREMDLSAEALGILGGTYFIVFAVAQIPCGILLDHYGPRLINTVLLLIAAAGAVVFALSNGPTALILGRGIIGLGCATCFMGTLVILSRWFPPNRFPIMTALASAVGGSGALIATTPLAIVASWVGWRGTFLVIGLVTLFVAAFTWLVVRDAPEQLKPQIRSDENLINAIRGVRKVALNGQLALLLPLNTVAYGSIMLILGLWGTPYLQDVHGLNTVNASTLLMVMALSSMLGGLIYAWLASRIHSIKRLVLLGSILSTSIFALLAILPSTNFYLLFLLFLIHGLFGAYPVLIISHVRMIVPNVLMGRGLTLSNLFSFGGVGLMQLISGWVIGNFAVTNGVRTPEAYSTLFLSVALISGVAISVYAWIRDPNLKSSA